MEIKIIAKSQEEYKMEKLIKSLENEGFKLKRQYGGKMPNFEGFGAHLVKD